MLMRLLYWIYANAFWCTRGCLRTFFQEDEPRKTFDIVIPPPYYPWVYISAVWDDGEEEDVTEIVTEKALPDELLTPARLTDISGLVEEHTTGEDSVTSSRRIVRWEYMDSQTFEVREITSDGLVNAVKSKVD